MEQNFNKRYVLRFLGISIALLIVFSFLPTPGIFNLLVLGGVAFYVGKLFAKDNNRVPARPEHDRFALKGLLAVVAVVGILTGLMYAGMPPEEQAAFTAPFQEKSLGVMIVGTILAALMMYGCIHFGFGLGARFHMKKLEKGSVA
jgi:hypothetical protein